MIACTPPEVLLSQHGSAGGGSVVAAPSHDMFALGVLVFEQLARPAMGSLACSDAQRVRQAEGAEPYPWERIDSGGALSQLGRLRAWTVLRQCLQRDAGARPSAQAVVQRLTELGDRTLVA